jgi:glyoxylase I family protein
VVASRSQPFRVVSLIETLWQERDAMERPLCIEELDHVVLRCRDPERALAFYVDVLGLVEERRIEGIGLVQLRCGRSMLDLIPASGGADAPTPNVDHFCLGVDAPDMAAVARFLAQRGVEVIGEPTPRYGARGMGLSIYLRDPEGNVVELKQSPPREA